jgi:hypothetical protein
MAQTTVEVTGREAVDPVAAIEFCFQQSWTDGLPVIPPTEERVAAFLAYVERGREERLYLMVRRRSRQALLLSRPTQWRLFRYADVESSTRESR